MASIPDIELLASLANTPLSEPIPSDQLTLALSQPPFVALPGSMNIRDLGTFAPGYVKPRTVFRSGRLDSIYECNLPLLRSQLQISRIFDFRLPGEAKSELYEIEGIEVILCPASDHTQIPRTVFTDLASEEGRVQIFLSQYVRKLHEHKDGYKNIFEALKTAEEGQAVLFHCTGGKDRTGVMAALILNLMGAPAPVVADEYALTRIGIEPFREELLHEALEHLAPKHDQTETSAYIQGVREMLGSYPAVMIAFMEHLRLNFDGAEGYLRNFLGFSQQDVEAIRQNLRPSS
ncbi:Protein-tyrosine phosphatase active site protein [Penicillium atrosanguineum]|uniref:Protein-tyrosine phosphatase active site protein n=1 Tax=Penicillium atrosanguineum TaxID=1132637 RepID=A0A9W9PYN8_9EURO|nr:Protein-tyrosine phosphatase active site protein [Penicillium atrosanguineum]